MLKDSKKILQWYHSKDSRFWEKIQSEQTLKLFKSAAKEVRAYKDFLKTNKIDPAKIKSLVEVSRLPAMNKINYFHKNSFNNLARPGYFEKGSAVVTATSGSTGLPTYFPRTDYIDWQYSVLAEFFANNGRSGSTLVIVCFGMGIWVGGVITYQAFRDAGLRGQPLSIITPGIKKAEIFNALKRLAPNFDNVVIAGYPPFIKDVIDEAPAEGVDWKKMHLRILCAAESFSEEFRDYICAKTGISDPINDTLNIYGSAELGAMAFETPTSILVRRLALKHKDIYRSLFDQRKLPTLAQYNPMFVCFNERNGEILINAENIFPMVNYAIGDSGGVYSFAEVEKKFKAAGVDLKKEARKAGVRLTELPFVYVYERSDFTVSFYGANIFPQHIKSALIHKKHNRLVTGKFTMEVKRNKKHDEILEINVEMAKDAKASAKDKKNLTAHVMSMLSQLNSEYENNLKTMPKRSVPKLRLWTHEHPQYFSAGIKQKWSI